MCQWKFFVFRYNANTSESSGNNACEMSWAAFSESVVGVVSDVLLSNISVTSLIVGRVQFNPEQTAPRSELLRTQRTTHKSFPISRLSIKLTFSFAGIKG